MSSLEHHSSSSIPPPGSSRIRPPPSSSVIGGGSLPPQSTNPPPPTPTPSNNTLQQMSSSQSNARSMMPPPPKPVDRSNLVRAGSKTPAPTGVRGTSALPGLTRQRSTSNLARAGTSQYGQSSIARAGSIKRPGSSAGSRPGSAAGMRPGSAAGNRPPSSQEMRSPVDAYSDGYEEPVIPRKKRQAYDHKGQLEDAENEIAILRNMLREKTQESNKKDEILQQAKKEMEEIKYRAMTLQTQVSTLETNLALTQRQHEETRRLAEQEHERIQREQNRREEQLQLEDAQRKLNEERVQMQMEYMVKDYESRMQSTVREYETKLESTVRDYESRLENTKMKGEFEIDKQSRIHREKVRDLQLEHEQQVRNLHEELRSRLEQSQKQQQEQIESITREANEHVEKERVAKQKEVSDLRSEAEREVARMEAMMNGSGEEVRKLRREVEDLKMELNNERYTNRSLMEKNQQASENAVTMEQNLSNLRAKIDLLQSDGHSVQQSYSTLEYRFNEALQEIQNLNQKLRTEETVRRKLHNQIQEMKGNIRVFCRIRPPLANEGDNTANIALPDQNGEGTQIEIQGGEERTPFGNVITKNHPFSFDKVFGPAAQNADIYEEISQLVQSALDGYNVCIFAYGQTGSGKTFTMSSDDGMIPRAVRQIYQTARQMEERDWRYTMEGSFLEVYNENINDLLGNPNDMDKGKHEIRHDPKEMKTTVTGVTLVNLDSPNKVELILNRASKNRSVAATKANERSSRSHSVFILKLIGTNQVTGERCEGTLNLVDLAGSERLAHSQSTGDRLKETQSINKSLACLGDVIAALGNGKDGNHIPYRNSKLTYLLQYSLGGNSKTLMFVMVSPLQAHLAETLTSLKFATKVSNTFIGKAQKTSKKAIKQEEEY